MQTLTTHTTYFNAFIAKLAAKFQPLQIFNFSKNSLIKNSQGCFSKEPSELYCNYCLLLVTESTAQIDHEVQDFTNAHYQQGTVTVICHSKKSIQEAINANNRFFITLYTKGELIYSHNGVLLIDIVPAFTSTHAAANARKHYNHRFSVAEGFYLGANECLKNWEQYSVCVFMLHQAVEQLCIGLIRINMAYRSEFHNLNRLLQLCTCFSQAPLQLFTETAEDKRLFIILTKSYSAARYQASFAVSEKDAVAMCNKVSEFTALATQLCEKKIAELEVGAMKEALVY
jgi:HEPN domain-containing protein